MDEIVTLHDVCSFDGDLIKSEHDAMAHRQ